MDYVLRLVLFWMVPAFVFTILHRLIWEPIDVSSYFVGLLVAFIGCTLSEIYREDRL